MIGFFIGLACGVVVAVVAHVLFHIGEHENISMEDKEQNRAESERLNKIGRAHV